MFFSARVRLPPTEGAVSILVATTSAVLKMAGSLSGLSPLSVTPSSTAHISSLRSWLAGQTRWPTFSGISNAQVSQVYRSSRRRGGKRSRSARPDRRCGRGRSNVRDTLRPPPFSDEAGSATRIRWADRVEGDGDFMHKQERLLFTSIHSKKWESAGTTA